ncbi:hypothetical protein ANN_17466 [Periplaneta americana]|uniref:Transposase Tc1-like domain-containing protein n=1 Tax=Periplaneta americana TaxID=6978 RepID=A0ABQ8STZ0_PERAM|nr:hypothetical protein ANN_17466 [Periplaneta americana]
MTRTTTFTIKYITEKDGYMTEQPRGEVNVTPDLHGMDGINVMDAMRYHNSIFGVVSIHQRYQGQCYAFLSQYRASKRSGNMKAIAGTPRRRGRAQYQYVSSNGAECCYNSEACVEPVDRRGSYAGMRGSEPRNVTTAWHDHLVRLTVTDRTASSTVLSRLWSTETGVDLSASTVRRRFLRAGLVARIPLHRLSLFRNHQRLRLQWARERHHWRAEWQNEVFSDESHFNLSYNDGRIRVRRYRGERNLRACIVERHSVQTPSVMGNLNSNRYIRDVSEREVLPLLQATPHVIFQQDNGWPHVARNVQATGITASLVCTFTRHVAHRTCLGYDKSNRIVNRIEDNETFIRNKE